MVWLTASSILLHTIYIDGGCALPSAANIQDQCLDGSMSMINPMRFITMILQHLQSHD